MSRVGKMSIPLPSGVSVSQADGLITVSGPKGSLTQALLPNLQIETKEGQLVVTRLNEEDQTRAQHGLLRALLANMVQGVSEGFTRQLEINGVGYRVQPQGADLKFSVGFSHDVVYKVPEAVKVAIEQNVLTVTGIDKQQVGEVAAQIRAIKKPEPYKGKGIKYGDERVLRKSGKSGKEQTSA